MYIRAQDQAPSFLHFLLFQRQVFHVFVCKYILSTMDVKINKCILNIVTKISKELIYYK